MQKIFNLSNFVITFFTLVNIFASPPRDIPSELLDAYTQNQTIPTFTWYFDETVETQGHRIYYKEQVQKLILKAKNRHQNYYGITDKWLYELIDKNPRLVKGKKVAIVGSNIPWYEAIVLSYGGYPTTIEYNQIHMEDKRLKYLSVDALKQSSEKFDLVISISSFEHDGLGRYGDPLNPRGDLEAMKLWKKYIKEGGFMILSVPVGKDALVWNAHRIYGPLRLYNLIDGYEMVSSVPDFLEIKNSFFKLENNYNNQPIFLLKPLD